MIITFKYPFNVFFIGPDKKSLNLSTSFKYRRHSVTVSLVSKENIGELKEPVDKNKNYRITTNLKFKIAFHDSYSYRNNKDLFKILVKVLNRVLRNFRNHGLSPQIHEFKQSQHQDCDDYLYQWKAKISKNGNHYSSLIKKSDYLKGKDLIETLVRSQMANTTTIMSELLDNIEEAIQDDLAPKPEQEYFINSLELLRSKEYRLALIEGVICLEIVIGQYCRHYLKVKKKLSKKRVNDLIKPSLGLTARISGLLCLTMKDERIKLLEISKLLNAAKIRNKIVHETGNIPDGITEEDISETIYATLSASRIIALMRDELTSEPFLQKLANEISLASGLPVPTMRKTTKHSIMVDVNFFLDKIPNKKALETSMSHIITILSKNDSRFNPKKHLEVHFKNSKYNPYCIWKDESLNVIKKESGGLFGMLQDSLY